MKKLILIVDPQIDFINGSLPVPQAAEAMDKLADFLTIHNGDYCCKVVTTDWHPWFHSSFRENGGPWPMHCVQNTTGAAIWPALIKPLNETDGEFVVLRKGDAVAKEEYSIFNNPASASQLHDLIKKYEIDQIDICGLAGDICVLNTLKSGIDIYGKDRFRVLTEFSPSLDGGEALTKLINTELA